MLVGVYISTLRGLLDLTQADIATDARISERTVRTIEKGAHNSSFTTVLYIVQWLGGEPSDLVTLQQGADVKYVRDLARSRHDANVQRAEDRVHALREMSPKAHAAIVRAAADRRRQRQ